MQEFEVSGNMTRRDALRVLGAATIAGRMAFGAEAAGKLSLKEKAKKNLKLGLMTHEYGLVPVEEVARRVKEAGCTGVVCRYQGFKDAPFDFAKPDWKAVDQIRSTFERKRALRFRHPHDRFSVQHERAAVLEGCDQFGRDAELRQIVQVHVFAADADLERKFLFADPRHGLLVVPDIRIGAKLDAHEDRAGRDAFDNQVARVRAVGNRRLYIAASPVLRQGESRDEATGQGASEQADVHFHGASWAVLSLRGDYRVLR